MRGFYCLMLLMIVVTALIQSNHNMVAADSFKEKNSSASENNITYGCVGLHCQVDDDVEADLFMDQHGLRRMLASDPPISFGSLDQFTAVRGDCPPDSQYGSSSCLNSAQFVGTCPGDPKNRGVSFCRRNNKPQ
ncbi:uncharacterized protein LOC133309270 [Gastrolobium bilobum]|uniref:uncharacterized protein LOC133309270 n=1 Tax=Gastrolobium bilobum TaxID=150636 RepID=UPI002AB099AF|nr:uncharacterized protein LOC133309270 [Gastrolobium bilobum]